MGEREKSVTVVFSRVVVPGREEAFEQAVREWIPATIAFPGHLGVLKLRPPPGGREYGAVLRFRSREAWERFQESSENRAFLVSPSQHLEGELHVETAVGLEAWFASPGGPVPDPPLWKVAVLTWIGVNVMTLLLTYTLIPLTSDWPWLVGLMVFNAGVVVGLTWMVMPVLNWLGRDWLIPRTSSVNRQAVRGQHPIVSNEH